MSLPSIVLTPFAGAHDLLGVGYYGGPVEALLERVFNQGSRCSVVTADPIMDIAQQMLPLFDGDAALQDPGVALLVEFALNKDKGLGATCEPSSLHLVRRQRLLEEVVEVECPQVDQRVRLYRWVLFELHDFRDGWSQRLVSP